jgi:four helix bundle protein
MKSEKKKDIKHFRDLVVYRRAFNAAMRIFQFTKAFPNEERYSLTDQIRRASRSVCSNISEAWRKRKYSAVFKNKVTDAMQEASETQCWLEFALECRYIDEAAFNELDKEYEEILSMLNSMEFNSDKFCF